MDIYCRICGEPWDMDTLHEEIDARIAIGDLAPLPDHDNYNQASPKYRAYRKVYDGYYTTVREDFYKRGCNAMYAFSGGPSSWCVPKNTGTTAAMGVLIDVLGDDLDGIASMMEDAEHLGLVD